MGHSFPGFYTLIMKVVIALLGLVAATNAVTIYNGALPLAYGAGVPLTYGAGPITTYAAAPALRIQPHITKYSVKPIAHEINYAHPGYVAVTPGAKHIAPLPFGRASHHVNLAKAPGTE